ncbi:MAG TPA: TerB family tellurite resistance protein [Oscillatoriales cyanobacterium M59_W2019_021]|nr:MAG: TerB family tellurite resistance protein [Cyanobacteria bacterium J055]HIK33348.1 TerB family tellurite resistance protein [Oscillatoriales cyanobacterium M4454_W2019_049]HIK52404.1 TerB family tellurite resistance protein [Oscillatoriales cyanobacterium M59_W2019_021]
MSLQPPPPPSISPRQMNVLRIVASMAWSDGQLAQEEVDVMLTRFSEIFAKTPQQQQQLQQELQDYLIQNIPLEDLVPKLETDAERQLVLKLGYEVIASSARTPEEPNINPDEAEAYQKLVNLLALPEEVVRDIETQVKENAVKEGIVEQLATELDAFLKG